METGLCPANKDTARNCAQLNSMVYARVTQNGKEGRVTEPDPQAPCLRALKVFRLRKVQIGVSGGLF